MNPIPLEGATRTIGESQGYRGLPLRDVLTNCTVNGDGTPAMVSAWLPDEVERARIAAGEPIYLMVLGNQHPPVMLSVGEYGA